MGAARAPRDPAERVTFYLKRAQRVMIRHTWPDIDHALEDSLPRAAGAMRPGYSSRGSVMTDDAVQTWRETLGFIKLDCQVIFKAAVEFEARIDEELRRHRWGERQVDLSPPSDNPTSPPAPVDDSSASSTPPSKASPLNIVKGGRT